MFVLYHQLIPRKRSPHTVWNSSPTLKTSVGLKKTPGNLYHSQRGVTVVGVSFAPCQGFWLAVPGVQSKCTSELYPTTILQDHLAQIILSKQRMLLHSVFIESWEKHFEISPELFYQLCSTLLKKPPNYKVNWQHIVTICGVQEKL